VVAVTRGQDKAAYLQRLGADAVIDTAAPAAAGQRLHKLVAAAAPKGESHLVTLCHKRPHQVTLCQSRSHRDSCEPFACLLVGWR